MGSTIRQIEFQLGEKKVHNDSFISSFPDYDFRKFEKKVGIYTRYKQEKGSAIDMAIKAIEKLFERGNYSKHDIDFILYCTQSPEHLLPTNACLIQERCNFNTNTGVLDFNLGCSGYVYGLMLADSMINNGSAKNVLLVTADTYSKYIHPNDLINQLIFSDAATATIISESSERNIGKFTLGTNGKGAEHLIVRNNFFDLKNSINNNQQVLLDNPDNFLFMDGPEIFNFTINSIPQLIDDCCKSNKIEKKNFDQFILHQANEYLIKSISKLAQIDPNKVFLNLRNYGNTISGTIPMALKNYSQNVKSSNNILLAGFGVGLSWAATQININSKL